jgi:hypothetical protein
MVIPLPHARRNPCPPCHRPGARERCRRLPTAARASSQTRARTAPQPDAPSLVAWLPRRPLRCRLRRPDARRRSGAPRTHTLQGSAADLRFIGQCRAPNVRRQETTTSTHQHPRMGACLPVCRIAVIACRAPPARPVRRLRIAAARCRGRDQTAAADRRTVIAPPSAPSPPRVLARGQAPSGARRDRLARRRQRHHPSRRASREAQGSLPLAQGRDDRRGHPAAVSLARVLADRSGERCHAVGEDRST